MTDKVFPGGYAHGTITLTSTFYGSDGSSNVYFTTSDIVSLACASFNGRTGSITLNGSDVTTALGYTPISALPPASATVAGVVKVDGVTTTMNNGVISAATASTRTPRVITAAGPVQALSTDGLIVVNKTAGEATTVTLESSPTPGSLHRIKDGKGDAATNPITIVAASGTIDGVATVVINQNRGALTLEYSGTEWSVT